MRPGRCCRPLRVQNKSNTRHRLEDEWLLNNGDELIFGLERLLFTEVANSMCICVYENAINTLCNIISLDIGRGLKSKNIPTQSVKTRCTDHHRKNQTEPNLKTNNTTEKSLKLVRISSDLITYYLYDCWRVLD